MVFEVDTLVKSSDEAFDVTITFSFMSLFSFFAFDHYFNFVVHRDALTFAKVFVLSGLLSFFVGGL
jgi:hypothetical protein